MSAVLMCVFTQFKAGWFARVEVVAVEVAVVKESTQRNKANHPDSIGMILFTFSFWNEGKSGEKYGLSTSASHSKEETAL